MLSQFDKENIQRILSGYGDWFSAQLLRLIAKSDVSNLNKLEREYPEHVKAVRDYRGW